MNKNLSDYIKVYNLLDAPTCASVIADLQSKNWIKHKFYSVTGLVDNGSEPEECHEQVNLTPVLQQATWEALRRYILEDINFSWFPGWQGFSNLKFIKYNTDTEMTNHCDHIHSLYDGVHKGIPILTIIGVLNEDFEGGELVMFEDQVIPLKQGDIVVFPSLFLYPHRVDKIKKGIRYSFVSWCN
jgi:predicted 2-oxoglutarate/Fe(II)-dependent dioxygenase YbiX